MLQSIQAIVNVLLDMDSQTPDWHIRSGYLWVWHENYDVIHALWLLIDKKALKPIIWHPVSENNETQYKLQVQIP